MTQNKDSIVKRSQQPPKSTKNDQETNKENNKTNKNKKLETTSILNLLKLTGHVTGLNQQQ